MYYDFLLNANDIACLDILRSFAQEPSHRLERIHVGDEMGLTTYQLNKFLTVMNQDLAEVAGEQPSYIEETTKGTWTGHNITTFTTQKIYLLYLRRSNFFAPFEYRAFYSHQKIKISTFAQERYTTGSTFYKNDVKLKKLLDDNDFYSIAGVNQDPEFIIRLRLFQLYYTAYAGIERPMPQLSKTTDAICKNINHLFPSDLKPTQQVKLETMLKVWIMRQQDHQEVTTSLLKDQEILKGQTYYVITQAVTAALQQDLQMTPSSIEIEYLFSFLVTQGLLGLDDTSYIVANFPTAVTLSNDFINIVDDSEVLQDLARATSPDLFTELLSVNLQFTTFYIEPTTFISSDQVTFFKELYPTFDLIIRRFLSHLKQTLSLPLSERMIVNLYFSYMFCLVNTIPSTATRDRVFICVDFSEGSLYTNYVVKSLKAFNNAHIVIQRRLMANTDIYISDYRSMTVTVPQVTWLDPPTAQDWSELADLILSIKQQRLRDLFKENGWLEE